MAVSILRAEPPVASYVFPAGGQRGTTVDVRVGGLFLHKGCGFEMLGPGIQAGKELRPTKTVWFEGPLLPLPDSQQAEDYPKDLTSRIAIAADAPLGERAWRVWTAQGATPAMKFVVGDLPEVVEDEIEGDPVPVAVKLPVTVNGRIFPREDVDLWAFELRKGQTVCAEVEAGRIGSPLDARLEVLDPQGRPLAEDDDTLGADPRLHFTAPADGTYQVRIHDVNNKGGQAYVYRLTLTCDPYADRVFPLGGRRGTTLKLAMVGQGLRDEPVEVPLPADGPRDYAHRLTIGGKHTNPFLLDLDDLPEHLESEPNDAPSQGQLLELPAMANGVVGKAGDVDFWAAALRKGEAYEFELRAARLGSPLSGVLAVCDAAGKELARAEAAASPVDPVLRFTAPADGMYLLRVTDQFRSRGGPEFAYRLRLARPPAPDFRLQLAADAVTLPRGGTAKLKVQAERLGGHTDPIALTLEGLPASVTAAPLTIPTNQNAVEITLKAEASAAIQASRLAVRGSAKVGAEDVTRTASLPGARGSIVVDSVLLAVALPTPFKVVGEYDMRWAARGTVHRRHYRIERNGYDGPLEVCLTDRQARHLQGVTGPTITVPAGASEFDYAVQLPPWMETGRTCRVCVMAFGVIKDGGAEHVVSFSSVQQNEQLVAVVEPGRLGVETDRPTLTAAPGKTIALTVRVARGKGLSGPVRVELLPPAHLRGVSAEAVEVADGRMDGVLTLRFAGDARGPYNAPLVIRATTRDGGDPVVAETRVEILPPDR